MNQLINQTKFYHSPTILWSFHPSNTDLLMSNSSKYHVTFTGVDEMCRTCILMAPTPPVFPAFQHTRTHTSRGSHAGIPGLRGPHESLAVTTHAYKFSSPFHQSHTSFKCAHKTCTSPAAILLYKFCVFLYECWLTETQFYIS